MKKMLKNWVKIMVLGAVTFEWNFSGLAMAHAESKKIEALAITQEINTIQEDPYEVVYKKVVPITAYSSTVDQCDSTPCITANGFNLCKHNQENVIAANFLPFGTKIRISEHFGDKIFTVQDRMNARYYYRADLWMQNRQKATQWGIRYAEIEVLK